ncbi:hypothetical protein Lnau_1581 [Legionella nautarum]|uniref:Coiled-coil protein n=1 Tax=Legionella nautarum TaxID=45070 RepID=A0A0W0WWB1_9GAMM|nr:hypothetical protein [Legionella nautarum]KTD36597.1 hypothetical protein Lnau_1581 [Legionella nautarum]
MGDISILIKSSFESHDEQEKASMRDLFDTHQAKQVMLNASKAELEARKRKLARAKKAEIEAQKKSITDARNAKHKVNKVKNKVEEAERAVEAEDKKVRAELLLDTAELAAQRNAAVAFLPSLRTYYKAELDKLNPAMFAFLHPEQKKRLVDQLIFTYYLLYAQYQLDEAEERRYTLEAHRKALELCAQRIKELETTGEAGVEVPYEVDLEANISLATMALKYLGITAIASWFVEKITQFMDNNTGSLVEWMGAINVKRLYWVWGGSMLTALFEMIPDDFYNKLEAQANMDVVSPVTGYMSWILYYTRFGINLFLLLKHVYCPSKDEMDMSPEQRFITQWNQRKFALMNDSIWGFANMLCHLLLKGPGMLGYAGNIVTVGLLVMDVILTIWRFWEEHTKYQAAMLALKRDKEKLEKQIAAINEQLIISPVEEQQLKDLEADLKQLNQSIAKTNFEWKYKKLGFTNEVIYAVGLVIAFSIMCCFFFPPAAIVPATALIITLSGAALCFVLTFVTAVASGAIEIAKTKETRALELEHCNDLLEEFKTTKDPNRKKQLYLEIKLGLAESEYQQKVIYFQIVQLLRSSFIDALIPPLVFVSLIFVPIGIGIAILAAGLALAIISNAIINRFEPQREKLPDFDESAFLALPNNENLTLADFEEPKNSGAFAGLIKLFGVNGNKPNGDYVSLAQTDPDLDGDIVLVS